MLIESDLPRELWVYAVQTAAIVRNRCFNNRTKQTPYFMLTGKQPNLSRMHKFGSMCYAYRQDKKKLDPRCDKGIFVGYDRNSPAYLVYYPNSGKVLKHRLIKCVSPSIAERRTQTDKPEYDDFEVQRQTHRSKPNRPCLPPVRTQKQNHKPIATSQSQVQSDEARYPTRVRMRPAYLNDYVTDESDDFRFR